jgi:hypothetical protein
MSLVFGGLVLDRFGGGDLALSYLGTFVDRAFGWLRVLSGFGRFDGVLLHLCGLAGSRSQAACQRQRQH